MKNLLVLTVLLAGCGALHPSTLRQSKKVIRQKTTKSDKVYNCTLMLIEKGVTAKSSRITCDSIFRKKLED